MQKCKPKFTLLLPVDKDGLTGGGGEKRNDRNGRWAIPKEQMSHTSVSGRLDYTNMADFSDNLLRALGSCPRTKKKDR